VSSLVTLFERDPEPPLEVAALTLAADLDHTVDEAAVLRELDELAAPLTRFAASPPLQQARALADLLHGQLGFQGDEESYDDPRNSNLREVLRRRRGLPITLSILYVAVGRRAGFTIEGISFPGHYLVCVGGEVYQDPFGGGRILDDALLLDLAARFLGTARSLEPEHLTPATARETVVRMLHNLRRSYAARNDMATSLLLSDRLFDLTGRAEMLRDRGMLALALGATASAQADLEAYLESEPEGADRERVLQALERCSETPRTLN